MVYRRKKNVRFRKTTKRVVRKNAIRNIARMGKLLNSRFQVYNFTRKCEYDQIYPTFGNAVDRVFTFALADLPNYTEFTTLFDQYRINAVKLTFIPRLTSADSNPLATVSAVPRIWTVVDYDDSSTLGSTATAMQYQNCRIKMMNKMFSIYCKPKVDTAIYNSAISTAYAPKGRIFIDSANSSVPHYGVKIYVEPVPADGQFTMTVIAKFYMQFKNVR